MLMYRVGDDSKSQVFRREGPDTWVPDISNPESVDLADEGLACEDPDNEGPEAGDLGGEDLEDASLGDAGPGILHLVLVLSPSREARDHAYLDEARDLDDRHSDRHSDRNAELGVHRPYYRQSHSLWLCDGVALGHGRGHDRGQECSPDCDHSLSSNWSIQLV
jgi:hypothetical protein